MNPFSAVMLFFSLLGGIDRIFHCRWGLGRDFEKGFQLLGTMSLSMIGMIVLAPWIASVLSPVTEGFYRIFHMDPAILPASLFANDMGGAPLAESVAKNESLGGFHALIVSSMMGCTVSFTIPYALGIVKKEHHHPMFSGFLCGIATIPVGCLVTAPFLNLSLGQILWNLLPLILFAAAVAAGVFFAPNATVKIFSLLGGLIRVAVTLGLLLGIFEFLTGIQILEGIAPIEEGALICFNAAIVLSGAFPLMNLLSRLLSPVTKKWGAALSVNDTAAMGLLSSPVTNATTLEMMNRMDHKGVFLNAAFAVSASFTFGGHLAFTMAFDSAYLIPMIAAKLISGFSALVLAVLVYPGIYGSKPKASAK